MSYPKIYEVLPKDIILQIQDYIEGEVIYIPKRSENKKSWGDCTDTKEILSLRNKKIYYDYKLFRHLIFSEVHPQLSIL